MHVQVQASFNFEMLVISVVCGITLTQARILSQIMLFVIIVIRPNSYKCLQTGDLLHRAENCLFVVNKLFVSRSYYQGIKTESPP